MQTLVVVFHVVVAVAIVGLVMLQQGKGADAGASFGAGASQTVFGSSGSGSFLVRATTIAAVLFYATSLVLAIFARGQSQLADPTGLPIANPELLEQSVLEQSVTVDELPQLDADLGDGSLPALDLAPAASDDALLQTIDPAQDDVPQVPGNDN